MNKTRKPRLGLCPIGKFVFSHEDALRQKVAIQRSLKAWDVDFVDLDNVLPDGLVRAHTHVDPVVAHFKRAEVDALFVPHCNFGTESAVGMIARNLGVPTLLWGPRDEAPLADGTRLRDSLCGMFASSKVLHKLGVPFTYIENCRIGDPPFQAGVDRFLRATAAASVLRKGARIGHIGQRIDFFWTTIIDESDLLQRFKIEVLPLDMVTFVKAAKDRVARGRAGYVQEARAWRERADVTGFGDDEPIMRILAVRDQMLAVVDEHGLDALAVQDFTSLVDEMGAYCFFANSLVSDTVPVSCESDIHGAISLLLAHRAGFGGLPVFLADITTRHPTADNGVLLWHGGAPTTMCHPDARIALGHHWILPSPLSGMPHFRLREGPITIARFDGDGGRYQLAVGEGRSMQGPHTLNNYVWMEVDDWPRWERLLMEGPFIHHAAMMYAHTGPALLEACKYVPGLEPVALNRKSTD